MANNRHNHSRPPREFFTLGEHTIGNRLYRFQYDAQTYRITQQVMLPEQETEQETLLQQTDSRAAYDAWNHIKRPERFGGIVVLPEPKAEE